MDNLEVELELQNPGAGDVVRQAGVNVSTMAKLLRESLPNIISKRWESGVSEAVQAAQLEDIITAMETARRDAASTSAVECGATRGLGERLLCIVLLNKILIFTLEGAFALEIESGLIQSLLRLNTPRGSYSCSDLRQLEN